MNTYNNIKIVAKEQGISINRLEKLAGISKGAIGPWNVISPTVRNLKKVANVLGCTVDELLK